jgi:hypothetical protein
MKLIIIGLLYLFGLLSNVQSFQNRKFQTRTKIASSVFLNKFDSEPVDNTRYNQLQNFMGLRKILPVILIQTLLPVVVKAASKEKAFLTDPTDEFRDEEKRVAEFNKVQNKIRSQWDEKISALEKAEAPDQIEAILKDLITFLRNLQNVPTGYKKKDLVKLCRSKKFSGKKIKPTWTKNVEIAYQALIQEYNKQLAPKSLKVSKLFYESDDVII